MTSLIITTKSELAAEFTAYHIGLPKNSFLSKLGIIAKPELKADTVAMAWPDGITPAAILGGLATIPLAQITTFSVDTEEIHLIFQTAEDGVFTLFSTSNEAVTLVCGLKKTDIYATFAEILGLVETAPPTAFNLEMSLNATTAFFAILDRLKLLLAASLVERTGLPSLGMRLEDLSDQLKSGENIADYRWFCAILPKVFNMNIPRTLPILKSGCDELESMGVLSRVSEGQNLLYEPSAELVCTALELIFPAPSLVFSSADGTKNQALVAGRSTWSMRHDKEQLFFESIDGLAAFRLMVDTLDLDNMHDQKSGTSQPAKTEERDRAQSAVQNNFCVHCGEKLNAAQKFCTKCGTQI